MTLLHLPPLTVSLARSNHTARSHSLTARSHPLKLRSRKEFSQFYVQIRTGRIYLYVIFFRSGYVYVVSLLTVVYSVH
jgi:hypothetical protein